MAFTIFRFVALFFCFSSFLTLHADEIRDNATGTVFPSEVSFEYGGKDYHLQATGVATRKKFFVAVYSVASYLEQGPKGGSGDKFQEFMQDYKAKQLSFAWLRNVNADKVRETYQESFKNAVSGSEYSQLQNDINKYIRFFNRDFQKGDEQIIRWIPGGNVEVIINGETVGSINNPDFARALWKIWFGEKSVVNRDNLTSLMR